jgi:UDP-glucose 4-epimerase
VDLFYSLIRACETVVGKKLKMIENKRRPGDPPVLIASSKKIKQELNWIPHYPDIKTIVHHAWHWHSTHPLGYSILRPQR